MRSLVGKLFDANEQHVLDWYHIARRFEAIGKGLVYLPHVEDFEHRLSRHWQHLNRAMWKVWHGNLYGASIALNNFYDGVDIHIMISEEDSSRSTRLEQVRERLAELWSYLIANQTRLINYGREYREGHRISTARVESTVDQLVDWRMEKKQHMRWTKTRRADVAPRALCADQRRTGQIHRVVAHRFIAGAGRGGMNPQILSSPDLSTVRHLSCVRGHAPGGHRWNPLAQSGRRQRKDQAFEYPHVTKQVSPWGRNPRYLSMSLVSASFGDFRESLLHTFRHEAK